MRARGRRGRLSEVKGRGGKGERGGEVVDEGRGGKLMARTPTSAD